MTALAVTVLGSIVAPLLLGGGLLRLLGGLPHAGHAARAAWAYLLGQFVAAWCTFAWLHFAPGVPGWILPITLGAAGILIQCRRAASPETALPPAAHARWSGWATLALALLVVERCSTACLKAIVDSDEANIWSAKARVLFAPGGAAAWHAANYVQAPDYPNFGPLVQVLAFVSHGEQMLWENRVPVQAFALAILLLLAYELQRRTTAHIAIMLLTAFATTGPFLTYAPTVYSDVIVAFSLLATVVAGCDALRGDVRSAWPLACIAASVLLAAKNEGRMLLATVLAAFSVACLLDRQRVSFRALGRRSIWIGVPILTFVAGIAFNFAFGFVNDHASPDPSDGRGFLARLGHWLPVRIGPLLDRAWRLFTDGPTTRWLLPCAVLAPLIARSRWRQIDILAPLLVVVFASIGYIVVFLGVTASHPGPMPELGKMHWHFDVAADRLCLHLMPTAAIVLAVAFGRSPRSDSTAAT